MVQHMAYLSVQVPAHIYRRLKEDCDSGDTHSAAIKSQKDGIITRAGGWFANGEITKQQLGRYNLYGAE